MSTLLEVTDLSVTFPTDTHDVAAVRGLDFQVDAREVVAIVGESGSGKSASAMAIVGLLPDYAAVSGSARLHGNELLGLSDKAMSRVRGKTIGTVFQDPMSALTPVYTIGDQIAEALLIHQDDMTRRAARARAVELLDLVGIAQADRRVRAFPHELSGGERQRVVIAIAIANDPDLLICDEPTTALDVTVQAQILDVLKTARDVTNAGVIIITHDLGVVAEFADRAVVMYAGRAVEAAGVEALYGDRRMPYTAGLLGSVPRLDARRGARLVPIPGAAPSLATLTPNACPFAPRCPLAIDDCVAAEPELVTVGPAHQAACIRTEHVAGRSAAEIYGVSTEPPMEEVTDAPVVLRVSELAKTYPLTKGAVFRRRIGEVRAVDAISFELRQGRTLGIVGESGSGKSTTLHEILKLSAPQAGSIEVLGTDVATADSRHRRALRGDLQVVFQDPTASLDPRLPVFDVIAEPLLANGFDKGQADERVAELLDVVGLRRADASRYPAEFSGGQKQRIGIARALATQPKILALDEPVSALDVSIQAGIINLLLDLQQQFGLAYLFVSHDLSVVRHLAHDVAVMYKGTIVEQGDAERVFADPQHKYTRRLLEAVPQPPPDVPSAASAGAGTPPPPEPPEPNEPPEPSGQGPRPLPTPPTPRDTSGRRAALRIAAALVVIVALVAAGMIALRFGTGKGGSAGGAAVVGSTNDINPQDPATLRDGGNLRLSITEFPVNFNRSQIDGNSVDTAAVESPTLPGDFIVRPDGSTTVDTDYFTKIELTKTDPQQVTYTINPQAVWSDGSPITWEDIASYIQATSGKDKAFLIVSSSGSDRVATVTRGVDDRQAVVTFAKPYSEWQGMIGGLMPRSMTATPEAFNNAQKDRPGPSAGPFIVTTIDRAAQRIVLTRNPRWWGKTPRLDSMTFTVLDQAAEVPALQNNALDAVELRTLDDLTIAQRTPGISIRRAPAPTWNHFTFNGAPGSILADPKLRLAVMKAIDRQAITSVVQRGLTDNPTPLNNHIFLAGQKGYQDNSGVAEFNPEQARRDLDALGWKLNGGFREKNGRPLVVRLVLFDSKRRVQTGLIAQNNLARVGIDLRLDVKSSGNFFSDYINTGDFDITTFGWSGGAFPLNGLSQIYASYGGSNFGKIGNAEIDAKIDAVQGELDPDKARKMANEIDLMLWQEGFSLPLFQEPGNVAVRDTLANYGASGIGSIDYTAIGFMK